MVRASESETNTLAPIALISGLLPAGMDFLDQFPSLLPFGFLPFISSVLNLDGSGGDPVGGDLHGTRRAALQ